MNKIKSLLFLLLFVLIILPSKGQEIPKIPINTVVERVQKYFGVYPVEKVHLHFDKPYYAVGDTLWFKMYLHRNLVEYEPSKVGYVEVINGRDSLVQTLRIPLDKGTGNGYLVLDPQYIKQDNYRFRAYTKWMMNFDGSFFFNKIVPIGDAINKKMGTTITYIPEGNKTKAQIQFKDARGDLLGKRKITWEAIDGWDPFDKGKSETDDMGRASITFSSKDKEILKNGRLIVKVEAENASALIGDFPLKNALKETDVQFFPEGGDLIGGVAKNVAFKAIGSDGKGLAVKGKVIDSKKNTVAEFSDLGLGMGYFSLLPQVGESYKAVVAIEGEEERTFDLPVVKEEAVNLVYHKSDDNAIQIGLITSENYFSKIQNSSFYILAQLNGHLVYAAQATLKNSSLLISVPKEDLPSGIIQFTVLTPQGKPISERLVFNKGNSELNIQVKSNKQDYVKKEAVKLDITNISAEKLPSHLSISVIDEAKVPYDDHQENTIVSSLLLTSDLKGYVEKPNFYFDENVENRAEALDALMMTQGFRRFDYTELIAEKFPQVNFMPEQGISLSGILRLNTGRPYPNGGLLLSVPARALRKDTYTDQNGRFSFENLVFPDSVKVTINARSNDNYRNLVINMDQSFYPAIDLRNPYTSNEVLNIDQQLTAYLTNSKNEYRTSILIDEVTVTGVVRQQRTSKEFSALSGLSMADHRIEGERLSGCNVLTMCLTTMLTGVTYDSQTLKYYITRNYNQGSRTPVQFFLNGMPIDEPSLNSIQTAEVEAIEIFLRDDLGTVSRMYQNDGVVSIITKKEKPKGPRMSLAEIEAMLPKSNVIDMFPLGYIKERTFYSPKYDTDQSRNTNDYRSTVYWNPSVVIDESGEISLDYYNADGNGKYKVVVEGIDDAGKIGRSVYYYNVN
ncbi:carboxypeptidase-like regulatory domain-containing protein [Sphingobacterium pedocola]|uniref:Carboxypeptidase regulatory-like domain-containing protein n=1 Tax=Sphingobacterium pedocola TaxID=2082722 RepID=A0ABR9TCY2_9SPHI|nr:carboxypeptidase-like regulatory domain-containing protein [Sphingobacterium pedocola]MBE8723227.1 carboxypeptidase regulatory-like domain-containing protein [Sphingobacterium pedocola]